jgi:hypothetical protein
VAEGAERPQDGRECRDDPGRRARGHVAGGQVQEHLRRARRADPPCAEPRDEDPAVNDRAGGPQEGAGTRQHGAFDQEHSANRGGRESQGPQRADLPHPLLHAEAEEQPGQQRRTRNQEEAEVHEVLAEVGGSLGRGESLPPHGCDGKAGGLRVEPASECLCEGGQPRFQGGRRRRGIAPWQDEPH